MQEKSIYFARSASARPWTTPEKRLFLRILNDSKAWPYHWHIALHPDEGPDGADWSVSLETRDYIHQATREEKYQNLSVTFMKSPSNRMAHTMFDLTNWTRVPDALRGEYSVKEYRTYVVLHECGHALGIRKHSLCRNDKTKASIMQQQTLGLKGCTKNVWPTLEDQQQL